MTPGDWIGLSVVAALLIVALVGRHLVHAVQDLTDVLGHDHDTRHHADDPIGPHTHPEGHQR